MNVALDKFFCNMPEMKVTDKQIEFPSEKEANEYCRENGIDPHNVILMGDKYIIKTKDSNFRTAMDKAIQMCDENGAVLAAQLYSIASNIKKYSDEIDNRKEAIRNLQSKFNDKRNEFMKYMKEHPEEQEANTRMKQAVNLKNSVGY